MSLKKLVSIVLLCSVLTKIVEGTCGPMHVIADAVGQARDLVAKYDAAQTKQEKMCFAKNMRDLLRNLKAQSNIFGKAMEDEVMSGDLEASIVNEQEQMDLKKAIAIYEKKLAIIDAEKSELQGEKRVLKRNQLEKEHTTRKRRRG